VRRLEHPITMERSHSCKIGDPIVQINHPHQPPAVR